jgi:hypothetical protein
MQNIQPSILSRQVKQGTIFGLVHVFGMAVAADLISNLARDLPPGVYNDNLRDRADTLADGLKQFLRLPCVGVIQ